MTNHEVSLSWVPSLSLDGPAVDVEKSWSLLSIGIQDQTLGIQDRTNGLEVYSFGMVLFELLTSSPCLSQLSWLSVSDPHITDRMA